MGFVVVFLDMSSVALGFVGSMALHILCCVSCVGCL